MILDNFDWSWAKRILVCGGREFSQIIRNDDLTYQQKTRDEINFIYDTLCNIISWSLDPSDTNYTLLSSITIIEGGARGVDRTAKGFAEDYYPIGHISFPADWKKYGKAAGAMRNKQMLDEGTPDLVVAFPGGKGTANMISQATHRGVPVIKITLTQIGDWNYEFLNFKE